MKTTMKHGYVSFYQEAQPYVVVTLRDYPFVAQFPGDEKYPEETAIREAVKMTAPDAFCTVGITMDTHGPLVAFAGPWTADEQARVIAAISAAREAL